MPTLNYTTPLHTFTSSTNTYTATKECYLMGGVFAGLQNSGAISVSINGNKIFSTTGTLGYLSGSLSADSGFIPPLKLSAGDTVTITYGSGTTSTLCVYDIAS